MLIVHVQWPSNSTSGQLLRPSDNALGQLLRCTGRHHACTHSFMPLAVRGMAWRACTAGGAPKRLVVLMEGESLFNDATSIVLFEIFFNMVKRLGQGEPGSVLGPWGQAVDILGSIFTLAAGEPCRPFSMHGRKPSFYIESGIDRENPCFVQQVAPALRASVLWVCGEPSPCCMQGGGNDPESCPCQEGVFGS